MGGKFEYGKGVLEPLVDLQDILSTVTWLITGVAVLYFFWIIVQYVFAAREGKANAADLKKRILPVILLLFVMFSIYALIGLLGDTFNLTGGQNRAIILQ